MDGIEIIIRDSENFDIADSINGIVDQVEGLLDKTASNRTELGWRTAEFIAQQRSHEPRWRLLVTKRDSLHTGTAPGRPEADYFLPGAPSNLQLVLATRGF